MIVCVREREREQKWLERFSLDDRNRGEYDIEHDLLINKCGELF